MFIEVSYISALNWQKKIVLMQILPEKYFFTKMVEKNGRKTLLLRHIFHAEIKAP